MSYFRANQYRHPVHEIRSGFYTDIYFLRSKQVLENEKRASRGVMQIFQKNRAVVCGIHECIALLKNCTGYYKDPDRAAKLMEKYFCLQKKFNVSAEERKSILLSTLETEAELESLWTDCSEDLKVLALEDGDTAEPWETVMHIEGRISDFIHLETVYLGILARATRVATNVRRVVEAAGKKPVLFFSARFDRFENQKADGYAAKIGGAAAVSTDAQGFFINEKGSGTIPHALIAAYNGNTVEAVQFFFKHHPAVRLIALVDFENDCVKNSLEAAREMGEHLWGVRLDTSGTMVDKSVIPEMGSFNPLGVNYVLVEKVRKALDKEGFHHVKIVVSGGFNQEKIRYFEDQGIPVDAYGVGSSLLKGSYDYTADIVKVNGKHCAKAGRKFNPNSRMKTFL